MIEDSIGRFWQQERKKAEQLLRPEPKHPEALLYRSFTIFSEATGSAVHAGYLDQSSLDGLYTRIDEIRLRAQQVDFEVLSDQERQDTAQELADGVQSYLVRMLYPELGGEENG